MLQVEPGVLLDLRSKLDTSEFRSLLLFLVGWRREPEQDALRLEQALQRLRGDPDLHVLGFERAGRPIAMIALGVEAPGAGLIRHIVVQPEWRGRGLGSALIRDAERHLGLSSISAETDRDAIAFYERSGFQVTNLGEKYPGVERFHCTRHSPFR